MGTINSESVLRIVIIVKLGYILPPPEDDGMLNKKLYLSRDDKEYQVVQNTTYTTLKKTSIFNTSEKLELYWEASR